MKIFITHHYNSIYGGEYKDWIEETIINPLAESKHHIKISENNAETKNTLLTENFDIVINTGYSIEFLTWINPKAKSKVISIIYDMNAEKMYEMTDENTAIFQELIIIKSKLIFLSSAIVTPSKMVKKEIDKMYLQYNSRVNMKKIYTIDYNITKKFNPEEIKYKRLRLFKGKYIVLPLQNNGLSDNIIVPKVVEKFLIYNDFNFKVVLLVEGEINQKLNSQIRSYGLDEKIFFVNNLSDNEKRSLYHFAIASFFISELDTSFSEIKTSLESDCLTFLSEYNDFYTELTDGFLGLYDSNQEIISVVEYIKAFTQEEKDAILNLQHVFLDHLYEEQPKTTINKIIYKMFL